MSFNSVEGDNLPSKPTILPNQPRVFEGQTIIRIGDQLSGYDDTSPTNEDQSKLRDSQPAINYSNTNGNTQSPRVAVPTNIKENILKVNYVIILACTLYMFTIVIVL